ncbi:uncharacterized protein [Haliotis cracherodii]|uniref:uncharacterized protein n=1 Tax=Haliotis cracherodii TaxID=6455 RepID=UPI0039EAD2B0
MGLSRLYYYLLTMLSVTGFNMAVFCVVLKVLNSHQVNGSATHNIACSDRHARLCATHLHRGHCEQDRWNRYLKNICKKTCNFCGNEDCVDVNRALCEEKQERGECDPSPYTLTMCKKTCGLCTDKKGRKGAPNKPSCKDTMSNCKKIAQMGFCDKLGTMKHQCKQSCNMCTS